MMKPQPQSYGDSCGQSSVAMAAEYLLVPIFRKEVLYHESHSRPSRHLFSSLRVTFQLFSHSDSLLNFAWRGTSTDRGQGQGLLMTIWRTSR
jgi:hypothetical protein